MSISNVNVKKDIKRIDKNRHIPDMVQAFSNFENDGLNQFYF